MNQRPYLNCFFISENRGSENDFSITQALRFMQLSIITINLNNKNGLEKTIKSVIDQTYNNSEYLVIDGQSNDGSVELIQEYSSKINYWSSEPDKGIYHAMNKGIYHARGDYIIFLNSGDYFHSNCVLSNVSNYLNEGSELVYGDIYIHWEKQLELRRYPEELDFNFFVETSLPHPGTFIKTQLFSLVGYYNINNKIVSDWEFFLLSVVKFGCSYQHIDLVVSDFIADGISSGAKSNRISNKEKRKAFRTHFGFVPKKLNRYSYENLKKILTKLKEKVVRLAVVFKRFSHGTQK